MTIEQAKQRGRQDAYRVLAGEQCDYPLALSTDAEVDAYMAEYERIITAGMETIEETDNAIVN